MIKLKYRCNANFKMEAHNYILEYIFLNLYLNLRSRFEFLKRKQEMLEVYTVKYETNVFSC